MPSESPTSGSPPTRALAREAVRVHRGRAGPEGQAPRLLNAPGLRRSAQRGAAASASPTFARKRRAPLGNPAEDRTASRIGLPALARVALQKGLPPQAALPPDQPRRRLIGSVFGPRSIWQPFPAPRAH